MMPNHDAALGSAEPGVGAAEPPPHRRWLSPHLLSRARCAAQCRCRPSGFREGCPQWLRRRRLAVSVLVSFGNVRPHPGADECGPKDPADALGYDDERWAA